MPDTIKLVHENQRFVGQTVYLTGQVFIDCTFTRCTLVVQGLDFQFSNCVMGPCIWHLNLMVHDHREWKAFLDGPAWQILKSLPRELGDHSGDTEPPTWDHPGE